jgi:hypothetical protein
MTDAANRSPEEWEREIERTRADIDRTLAALRHRLSRTALIDRVLRTTRDESGAFVAGIGRTVRDNPIPALVLGAGLAWLVTASRGANGARQQIPPGPVRRDDPHRSPTVSTVTVETPEPAPMYRDRAAEPATGVESPKNYASSSTGGPLL